MQLPILSSDQRLNASQLVASCSPDQLAQLCRGLDSDALQQWTYLPGSRPGLVLGVMDRSQRLLVHTLLGGVLSEAAHTQVAAIMSTEDVLNRREGFGGDRHSTDFWFLVFGDPDRDGVWAWRLEGHHICVHVTVVDDDVVVAPIFLGCNPAVIRSQGQVLSAPLGVEEALARSLMDSLHPEARSAALVAPYAPDDIYTKSQPTVERRALDDLNPGLAIADMDAPARAGALSLLALYASRLEGALGADLLDRLRAEEFSVAWEGSLEPGQAHYYRLLSAGFVFEHENAANNANHIHNVMRVRGGDVDPPDLLQSHRSHTR